MREDAFWTIRSTSFQPNFRRAVGRVSPEL
jgi:hypothetical protein